MPKLDARFHVDFGPPSLFERVRYKIRGPRNLVLTEKHFQERADQRTFPSRLVQPFDPDEWELLTAETLTNGKFMKTVWGRVEHGSRWLIVFAKGDVAVTVMRVRKGDRRVSSAAIKEGPVYEAVEAVNRALMDAENQVGGQDG